MADLVRDLALGRRREQNHLQHFFLRGAVPQRILSAWGGVLAEALGWAPFFLTSTFVALPGLLLLAYLMRRYPLAERSA